MVTGAVWEARSRMAGKVVGAAVFVDYEDGHWRPYEERHCFIATLDNVVLNTFSGGVSVASCKPRPNVTGPRQTRCHEFPGVTPVEQPEASQDDPGETAGPTASTTPADALPVRGEDAYWRTRWFLCSEDSPLYGWLSDVTSTMQVADRLDMRQDVCFTSWQYSVSAQYRGGRGVPSARSVRTLVERWLKRNGKADATVAISDTLAASVERYHEAMDAERAAITLEALRREQSRIAAEQAKAKPPAALVFTW